MQNIICFGIGLTLRQGNREYFYAALDRHFPGMRKKYHDKYGYAYEVNSDNNAELMRMLHMECKKHNIMSDGKEVFEYLHKFPENEEYEQLSLF